MEEKWAVEKMVDYWNLWEAHAGESFIDYFVDDNLNDMGFVIGYFYGKFPELGRYILEASDYYIPWSYVQDWITKKEPEKDIPSISHLVELFYNVENEDGIFNGENYDKSVYVWCSLIHDVDAYYTRFMDWIERNEDVKIMHELNETWKQEK